MVAMDEETTKLYLQNLEEFLFDDSKLVTYKWLSRELNLHVNVSKALLQTYLKRQKKIVHVTYLLSGVLKDDVTHKVLIVQEEDLETAKAQFKILSSEHVYSIQKTPKVTDLNSLYIIDRYKKNSDIKSLYNTMSAVHCNEAVERAADEISKLRIEVKACVSSTDIRASQDSKKTTPEADKNDAAASTSGQEVVTKSVEKIELGIAAMFATQGMRSLKQENSSDKSKSDTKQSTRSKNFIAMFLNRNIAKPEEKSEAEVSVVCTEKGVQKELLGDKSTAAETEISMKEREKPEKVNKKEKVSIIEHSTCKGKRKSTDDPPSKKRKRILHLSDSEDSDDGIFGSEDEEAQNSPLLDPEPASLPLIETDEVVAPTPQDETKPGRKRERKLKVSTFMDEDGYVVTKREYVVESCTDSEGEEEKKKKKKIKTEQNNSEKVDDERNSPPSEPPAKKKCSPQKVKQATLMNFFKRK